MEMVCLSLVTISDHLLSLLYTEKSITSQNTSRSILVELNPWLKLQVQMARLDMKMLATRKTLG